MEFLKTDNQRYIQNVVLLPTGELQWISGRGTSHFLILKVPVGYHPCLSKPEQQKWLRGFEQQLLTQGSFTDPAEKIEGVFFSAADFFRSGGKYKISGGNVGFYVYGCCIENDSILCYALNNVGGDVEYYAENLSRITVYMKEVETVKKVRLFKTEKKRFLRIRIETNDVLADNDLYYQVADYIYPVQRSMLKKDFYLDIPLNAEISFHSRSNAKIEKKDG